MNYKVKDTTAKRRLSRDIFRPESNSAEQTDFPSEKIDVYLF